jgi:hypothetical protein
LIAECCLVAEHFVMVRVDFEEALAAVPFADLLELAVLVAADIVDAFAADERLHSQEDFGLVGC